MLHNIKHILSSVKDYVTIHTCFVVCLVFVLLFLSNAPVSNAQTGRYGDYNFLRPLSDLYLDGINGRVHVIVSYEGMAVRTARGVVFSEEPLKIITEYNRAGNIMSKRVFRYGQLVEKSEYTYDVFGLKQTMKTTQSNGVLSLTIRYFYDETTHLNDRQYCYNYKGKLTQSSRFYYNENRAVIRRVDYNEAGSRDELLISKYGINNHLSDEYSYKYARNDSILMYGVHYKNDEHGNPLMLSQKIYNDRTGKYDKKFVHVRYYQYDQEGNWRVRCRYHNALSSDNHLIPNILTIREIIYY